MGKNRKKKSKDSQEEQVLHLGSKHTVLKVFLLLLFLELLIVALDIIVNFNHLVDSQDIRRIFDISREKTIVTWMSATVFMLVAGVMWVISYRARELKGRMRGLDWKVFSLGFVYLAIDDTARIHERVGTVFGNYAEDLKHGEGLEFIRWIGNNFPSYYWHVVYLPILAVMGLCLFLLLWVEFKSWGLRALMMLGFGLFALSQGLDYVEGLHNPYEYLQRTFSLSEREISHYSKALEEFLEMFGATLILTALLEHLSRITSSIKLSLR